MRRAIRTCAAGLHFFNLSMVYEINLFTTNDWEDKKMKRITFVLLVIMIACSNGMARTILVKIGNVRGNSGTILVMAQGGKDSQPIYGKAVPANGEATVRLENVEWADFDISVFHDENNNLQMDVDEDHKPTEGYVMKSCKPRQEEETYTLKMYYPVNN